MTVRRGDIEEAVICALGDAAHALQVSELYDRVYACNARGTVHAIALAMDRLIRDDMVSAKSVYGTVEWKLTAIGGDCYAKAMLQRGLVGLRVLLAESGADVRLTDRGGALEIALPNQYQTSLFVLMVDADPKEPINLHGGYVSDDLLAVIEIVNYWRRCHGGA